MAEMLERVMELENRFDTFGADLVGVRESTAKIDDRLGQVEVRLEQMDTRLGQVEVRLEQMDTRLGQVEVRLGRVEETMVRLEERIDHRFEAFDRRFENLELHMVNAFAEIRMTQRSDLRWILGGVAGSTVAVILSMFGVMLVR